MCFAGIEDEIRGLSAQQERPQKKREADEVEPPTLRLPLMQEQGVLRTASTVSQEQKSIFYYSCSEK